VCVRACVCVCVCACACVRVCVCVFSPLTEEHHVVVCRTRIMYAPCLFVLKYIRGKYICRHIKYTIVHTIHYAYHMYVCICIYVYMYIYKHTCTNTNTHKAIRTYIWKYIHERILPRDFRGETRMEWATIGLLDSGADGKLQWNTRGTVMQEVQGVWQDVEASSQGLLYHLDMLQKSDSVYQAMLSTRLREIFRHTFT
jgi:hypothetical protein